MTLAHGRTGGGRTYHQGEVAPRSAKFDFWRSMAALAGLVMRSGASHLHARIGLALLFVVAGKAASVWNPVLLGDAINTLLPTDGAKAGAGFVALALGFAALRLAAAAAPYARDAVFMRVSQATMAKAASETFDHTLALSLDFHHGKQTGMLSRIVDRGSRATDFLIRSVVFNLGPTAIELVLAMVVMVTRLDWRFAAAAFATVVLYTFLTFKITDWRIGHRRALNDADTRAAGVSVDAMMNYETVKAFGAEARVGRAFAGAMDDYVDAAVRANSSLNLLNAVQAVILNIGLAIMTVLAGYQVLQGEMRIGDVTVAILLLTSIYTPLNQLGFNYREIRQAFIDMEQMVELVGRNPDIVDAPDAVDLPPKRGEGSQIAFEAVTFRHDARSIGLNGVTFVAPPGTTTAFVGPSGAGKTTLVRMVLRLLDPQEGRVLIDGVDLKQVKQQSLRRAVALVPQDVALFNDTLYANVAFARPDASPAEVRAVADAAELGPFIDSLPDGLATLVGERGMKLSGGERQRVGIARALLAEPSVLVLDEATSALDGPTEAAIQETLRKVRAGRTMLVVAHRLSTIVDADQIVVLRRGRVVELGTHAELLAHQGEYAALWRRQTREA